ncbi:VWA domain-containing protein [Cryptosporangium sp. NPDC048952]|uniref:VWA domain-containing protein n=1 Tax=Cryptosporangium sp. NPDC048952 TaxID=3363961 RepID=UPI0037110DCE
MTGEKPNGNERPPRRVLVAFLLGVVALAGPAMATDPPHEVWSWTLLILASVAGSAGAVEAVYGRFSDWWQKIPGLGDLLRRLRELWTGVPALVRLVVPMAIVLVLTIVVGFLVPPIRADIEFWYHGCRPPPTLRVLTTPESLSAVSALATVYEQTTADARDGCAAADLYVYAADPVTVREALLAGWSIDSLRLIGPRPDVWMPDSTVDVGRVEAGAEQTGAKSPVVSKRSIAVSPVVLGIPAALVEKDPERWATRRTWGELLEEVGTDKLPVVRPDPTRSMTGAIATEVVYPSVAGTRTVPVTREEAADINRGLERAIGRALDSGTYPLGDAQAVLCRYRADTAPVGAVMTTEQQLVQYNLGGALGDSCPAAQDPPAAKKLVAVYPRDTVALDHPLVDLDWPNRTERQLDAGREWSRWLSSDDGRRALNDVGLRPSGGTSTSLPVVEPLTAKWGARPDALFVRVSPSVNTVDTALKNYAVASRPARTLVLLDTSGSMNTRVTTQRLTRLDAARKALHAAADQVAQGDQVALWSFPAGSAPTRVLVPLGSRPPDAGAAAFDRALAGVTPKDGTPLYRAVDTALTGLGPEDDRTVRTLIVITDGEDTGSGRPTPDQLAALATRQGIRVSIVALGEATCTGPALRTLSDHTGGDCVDAGTGGLSNALLGLFDAVGGGRGGN